MAKMKNAPVYYVLAQVRLNPIMTLEQYIPAIQDSMRKAGFPDFQKNFIALLNIGPPGQPPPEQPTGAVMVPQVRYKFIDAKRTAGFVLDPSFLMFHTTHYDTFEPFLETILRGISIVNRYTEWSYSERIGLRYLDAVIPQDGKDVSPYVSPRFLGFVGQFEDSELIQSVSETRYRRGDDFLTSRVFFYKHTEGNPDTDVAFPPDLGTDSLVLMEKFKKATGTYAIFDNDSWHDNREDFSVASIERHFKDLRKNIGRAFDLMATERALNMWA